MAQYQAPPGSPLPGLWGRMILFIHGFASCGIGRKSTLLKAYFGEHRVLAPDLPADPGEAVACLESLLQEHDVRLLVGSSLGAYFATWLNRERCLPAVLINPAIAPFVLLGDYLGTHTGCNNRSVEVSTGTLASLRRLYRPELRAEEPYLVLLQSGDELLDYRHAAAYYADKDVIIEPGGSHRFEDLQQHLPRIAAWARQYEKNEQTPT